MFILYIDPLTKKIIGYNEATANFTPDNITTYLIHDDSLKGEVKKFMNTALYFENGKIIKKKCAEDEFFVSAINKISSEISTLKESIKNEQKIFMDNVIGGMSVEKAATLSKKTRENCWKLEEEYLRLINERKEKTINKISEKINKRESGIAFKYFLSIVAVVRNENDYLEEWVRYHIENIGVEHFYIYDNESFVPVKDYLESVNFKHLNKLTIVPWKTTAQIQKDAYSDFLNNYGMETKWFSAIDPDEYVVIKDTSKTLKEFLIENDKCSKIMCEWKHFNANGQEHKKSGTDMERFTQEVKWDRMRGGKIFAHSARVSGFTSYIPNVPLAYTYPELNIDNNVLKNYFQLNHYYTRSYDEFVAKIKRGSSNPNFRRRLSDFFELNPDMKYLDTGDDYEQGYGAATTNT